MKTILFSVLLVMFCFCNQKSPAAKDSESKVLNKDGKDTEQIQKLIINYYLVPVNKETKPWLAAIKSNDTLRALYAINRVDYKHMFRQDTLVFPDTFLADLKWYSPFPETMEILKPVNKIIFYSYPIQAFAVYQKGELIRWGPNSMGKESTVTPGGLLYTNWKAVRTISTIDPEWIMDWYFNLHNKEGVSMHEYDLPGYPASHACVRLLPDDAYWFYNWADEWKLISSIKIGAYGTPVIIYGSYPFGLRKPWKNLASSNEALNISEENLSSEVRSFLPLILERQNQRDTFLLKKRLFN